MLRVPSAPFGARGRQPAVRKAAVRWSARITATAREGRNTTEKPNNDEAALTARAPTAPNALRDTVHGVAPERAPAESNPVPIRALARVHAHTGKIRSWVLWFCARRHHQPAARQILIS